MRLKRMPPSDPNSLSFKALGAWVNFKSMLGIPLSADWNYICDRLAEGIRCGEISRESSLTSTVRKDGFGSQALSRVSIQAAAKDLGVAYVHTPFVSVAHAEMEPTLWRDRCEELLLLGQGCTPISEARHPVVHAMEFFKNKSLWGQPHVIQVRRMLSYCNRSPAVYQGVIDPHNLAAERSQLRVAVHVRRGDISSKSTGHRFTSNDTIAHTIRRLRATIEQIGQTCSIEVFTNAKPDELANLAHLVDRIDNNLGALETFEKMREADILLTAKSAFSYLAALYSGGVVIYEPFTEQPLPNWIPKNGRGDFDEQQFAGALQGSILSTGPVRV